MNASRAPNRWPRYAISAAAGVLASLALPPTGWLACLLALSVPLFWLALAGRGREAAALGLAAGFGWFAVSTSWVGEAFVTSGGWHVFLMPLAVLGLPLLLGAFWSLAFLLAAVACRSPVARLLAVVALLALAEHLRGFVLTGFPWNTPGMVFATGGAGFGAGSILGLWGLNAAALLLAVVPALLLCRARAVSVAALASVVLVLGLGKAISLFHYLDSGPTLAVRLVQPNIPQEEKWLGGERRRHLDRLVELSRQAPLADVDLVVWPESAFAGFLESERGTLSAAAQAASSGRSQVLTGTLRIEGPEEPGGRERYYNSMALMDPEGRLTGQYDKRHLVPFGEYAPLRRFIPFADIIAGPNDFFPGGETVALEADSRQAGRVPMLPLICYEVIFPDEVRRALVETGARVIVTITNDAWFGDSSGPRQHLAMAQMRAAELGVSVIRVGNNGISAAIAPNGRILERIELNTAGVADVRVSARGVSTIYHRHGNTLFWAVLALVALAAGAIEGLTRKNPRQ